MRSGLVQGTSFYSSLNLINASANLTIIIKIVERFKPACLLTDSKPAYYGYLLKYSLRILAAPRYRLGVLVDLNCQSGLIEFCFLQIGGA